MSTRPRGLITLPLGMAACLLAGLLLALLAGPAWQIVAWALLALPVITIALLIRKALL
jgi:hypothetical protein